nr:hypothetical protein [Tanacetum cinerariifolium]
MEETANRQIQVNLCANEQQRRKREENSASTFIQFVRIKDPVQAAGSADNNVEEGDVDDQENKSEDPFQIYKLLYKNNKVDRNKGISDDSLKYPPGFTPHGSIDADSSNVVGKNDL